MRDMAIIAIWFWSVSAGVMLTILIPYLVSDPSRRGRLHDEWTDEPMPDAYDELRRARVRRKNKPGLFLLPTPSARDLPCATSDHKAHDQDQAAPSRLMCGYSRLRRHQGKTAMEG